MTKKTAFSTIAVLSALAFVNAAYLSYRAYELTHGGAFDSFCDINSSISCTNVLANPLAQVFGVPFPMIALTVYPILFILALIGLSKDSRAMFKPLAVLAGAGALFNGFIIYREAFFIHSYCILCLMCTAIIVSIFAISTIQLAAKESKVKKVRA
jgi:uncharacterized membrane protein